jgi:hypothetical protein
MKYYRYITPKQKKKPKMKTKELSVLLDEIFDKINEAKRIIEIEEANLEGSSRYENQMLNQLEYDVNVSYEQYQANLGA